MYTHARNTGPILEFNINAVTQSFVSVTLMEPDSSFLNRIAVPPYGLPISKSFETSTADRPVERKSL